ncbi:MAG: iron ABC transporter permease [Rhodospirillaceae bacterium]|nr:iron ABC transporter permease [Rhodospirillaceae bacterium]
MERVFSNVGVTLGSMLLAGMLCLPTIVIFAHLFIPMEEVWRHLLDTVLVRYITNTVFLALGVGMIGLIVGTLTGWLSANFEFPGHRLLHWALLLPLAVPTYATAFSYGGLCEFSGPIQTTLRDIFGWNKGDYWFPEVRSIGGAIFVMSFVLYPYVYLLGRAAFVGQARNYDDSARVLGRSSWGILRDISFPLARPSLIAGLALMLMEALSDFGAVQYLAVDTFTTGVYRTWFALGSPEGAARLASMLLLIIFLILLIEQRSRGQARYYQVTGRSHLKEKFQLVGLKGISATFICSIPVFLGFILPVGYLLFLSLPAWAVMMGDRFVEHLWNSFSLAALTSLLAMIFALFLVYSVRMGAGPLNTIFCRIISLGYGFPGSVIAIGVLIPMAWLDYRIDDFTRNAFGASTGLILTGGMAVVIFAYLVRFMALGLHSLQSSMELLAPNLDSAAQTLGANWWRRLSSIHIPLMTGGLLTGALLVFVDVMKELPATLILRPFNYDTLAVKAYELASDEALAASGCYALTIVAVGLIPVILISRSVETSGPYVTKARREDE